MQRTLLLASILLVAGVTEAAAQRPEYVPPQVRRDGTFSDGHFRTSPNGTRLDNYSTRGNTNPFTGERGSRPAYPSYSPPRAPSYGSGSRRR